MTGGVVVILGCRRHGNLAAGMFRRHALGFYDPDVVYAYLSAGV